MSFFKWVSLSVSKVQILTVSKLFSRSQSQSVEFFCSSVTMFITSRSGSAFPNIKCGLWYAESLPLVCIGSTTAQIHSQNFLTVIVWSFYYVTKMNLVFSFVCGLDGYETTVQLGAANLSLASRWTAAKEDLTINSIFYLISPRLSRGRKRQKGLIEDNK